MTSSRNFTKSFKKDFRVSHCGKQEAEKNLAAYKKSLLEKWEELPPVIVTSSVTGDGKEAVLQYIDKTNALFRV